MSMQTPVRRPARHPRLGRMALCLATSCALASSAALAQKPGDVDQLQIEDLLKLTVSSATRSVQPISEAPAAVTVITAEHIRRFGYRTLGEALDSVPGLYLNNDRTYQYIGARGFSRFGDYNTRMLLLIDGNRATDALYTSAGFSGEFPLEMESINRIEYVPGTGSAIYGSNAFFGVVNVITRHAEAKPGVSAVLKLDSQHRQVAWGGFTTHFGADAKLTIDVATRGGRGPSHYYSAFDLPGVGDGMERGVDSEHAQRLSARLTAGGFDASVILSNRTQGLSGAPLAINFNDPRGKNLDKYSLVDVGYKFFAGQSTDIAVRGFWGEYVYKGVFPFPGPLINRDLGQGSWYGAEGRITYRGFKGHTLQVGIEKQVDYKLKQESFDEDPLTTYLDDRRTGSNLGIFVQDEWHLGGSILTLGVRRDAASHTKATVNPRVSWVAPFGEGYVFKAAFGTAFRAPNAFERFYDLPGFVPPIKGNPSLKPERIRSIDLVLTRSYGNWTAGVNAYRYRMTDVIEQVTDPLDGSLQFVNGGTLRGRGADLLGGYRWANGARIELGWTLQGVKNTSGNAPVPDSPSRLAKLRVSVPMFSSATLALSAQGISRRLGQLDTVPGTAVSSLVLSNLRLGTNLSLDAGIYNLLDRRYAHPISGAYSFNAMPQDRRKLQLTLRYDLP